jgi:hypothetical protein
MNYTMKKSLRCLGLAASFCLLSTAAFAGVQKKPYLIYAGTNSTMNVQWQDTATETTNTLSWGTDTNYSLGSQTVSEYGSSHQHKYQITGLQPATHYYYKVADKTNGVYGTGSFVTAPATSATSAKFLAIGDTRSDPLQLEGVMQEMNKVIAADPTYQGLAIQAGDWVASDAETNWTNEWFGAPPFTKNPQAVAFLAQQPIDGVKGNHEDSSGYSTYFPKYYPYPYPHETAKKGSSTTFNNLYWSFDYGPIHFTLVDQYSTYTSGSAQYNWIVSDLAASTKPWKIIMFHEPSWGAGTGHANNTTAQSVFDPLIKQYGVAVVYNGHNHNYARCQVSTAGSDSIAPNVPYITNGGGGAPLDSVDLTYPHVVTAVSTNSYMTFNVSGNSLTINAYQVTQANGSPLSATVYNTNTMSTLIDTLTLTH